MSKPKKPSDGRSPDTSKSKGNQSLGATRPGSKANVDNVKRGGSGSSNAKKS